MDIINSEWVKWVIEKLFFRDASYSKKYLNENKLNKVMYILYI